MKKLKEIKVKAYSGYKGDEKPVSFNYQGDDYSVKEIMESCKLSEKNSAIIYNVFKIKTTEGKIFKLYYDDISCKWFLKTD